MKSYVAYIECIRPSLLSFPSGPNYYYKQGFGCFPFFISFVVLSVSQQLAFRVWTNLTLTCRSRSVEWLTYKESGDSKGQSDACHDQWWHFFSFFSFSDRIGIEKLQEAQRYRPCSSHWLKRKGSFISVKSKNRKKRLPMIGSALFYFPLT